MPWAEDVVGGGGIVRSERLHEGIHRHEVTAEVDGLHLAVEEGGLRLPAITDVELDAWDKAEHVTLNVEGSRTNLDKSVIKTHSFTSFGF